jgi:DNA invertase Pin-like site-specific DNA recombinase
MKLVRYCRVSSEGQADAYGLPNQHKDCRRWADAHGHRLTLIGDEVFTGTVQDRPKLAEAMQLIQSGKVDGMLVPRLDRLARALTIQEAILAMVWQAGGRVFSVDQGEILKNDPDDPMRTAMRQMQGVFAELERNMITKRMRDGIRAKRAQGRHATGAYPYGYRAERHGRQVDAAPDEREQAIVRMIADMRSADASYRDICAALNTAGHRTKRGRPWAPMTVKRIHDRETARVTA